MAKKSEAWREYREAAMIDMLMEVLPKVKLVIEKAQEYFSMRLHFGL